jgi:hypothetical protein
MLLLLLARLPASDALLLAILPEGDAGLCGALPFALTGLLGLSGLPISPDSCGLLGPSAKLSGLAGPSGLCGPSGLRGLLLPGLFCASAGLAGALYVGDAMLEPPPSPDAFNSPSSYDACSPIKIRKSEGLLHIWHNTFKQITK